MNKFLSFFGNLVKSFGGEDNTIIDKELRSLLNDKRILISKYKFALHQCDEMNKSNDYSDQFVDDYKLSSLDLIESELQILNARIILKSESLKDDLIKSGDNIDLKYKSKMHHNIGKSRDEMPQIDDKNLADFILHFGNKDVSVKKIKISLGKLKPAQNELDSKKIYNIFANSFNDDFEKKTYIISKDNYLLDGHHNWAAQLELNDESEKVSAYKINLPIKQLIKRSNMLSLSKKKDINDNIIKKSKYINIDGEFNSLDDLSKSFCELLNIDNRPKLRNSENLIKTFFEIEKSFNEGKLDIASFEKAKDFTKTVVLFDKQIDDEKSVKIGSIIDTRFVGALSGNIYSFDNMLVKAIDNDFITCISGKNININNFDLKSGTEFYIPKTNNKMWSKDQNFSLVKI